MARQQAMEYSQVPDSSPSGSVIDISTDGPTVHSVHSMASSTPHNSSALVELTQHDFIASQRLKTADDNDKEEEIPNTQYHDIRSAQTPPYERILSSPVAVTTQQTQQHNVLGPSAQLTSFRMNSPTKVNSQKRDCNVQLITQESFAIPNLLSSPINVSPSSQSIYCTARQPQSPADVHTTTTSTTKVQFHGQLDPLLDSSSPFKDCTTKIIIPKRTIREMIPDSSDDEDISIIEITRTIKRPKSVLQVRSSQRSTLPSSVVSTPARSPRKSSPLKYQSSPLKHLSSPMRPAEVEDGQYDDAADNNNDDDDDDDDDDELAQFSMEQLRQRIMHYGIKPSKSRLSMIRSIRQVQRFLSQDSLTQLSQSMNITQSQKIVRQDVFKVINDAVKQDRLIWEKIYTFQPLKVSLLQQLLKDNDIDISAELFKEWCDHNSICTTDDLEVEQSQK